MSLTSSPKGLWSTREASFREKNGKSLKYAAYLNSFEYSASLIYSNKCFWTLTLSDGGWTVWMLSVSPKSTGHSCFRGTEPHPVKLPWIWRGCCRMCSRVWGSSVHPGMEEELWRAWREVSWGWRRIRLDFSIVFGTWGLGRCSTLMLEGFCFFFFFYCILGSEWMDMPVFGM